ncbi:MAG: glycosyltransferase [Armatimonadetes bacterium]|nr:glycosyltransferase [Armatimonadota bacterium]
MARWLILSYFAGIDGMACSQHIDDRLPRLADQGIEAALLTSPCAGPARAARQAVAASVAPSGIRFEMRHRLRRGLDPGSAAFRLVKAACLLPVYPFYLLEKLVLPVDSQWSWFPSAARRGLALCREERPEVIYSTGGPPSAHLAAAVIRQRTGIRWIAEFQDPVIYGNRSRSPRALRRFARIERTVCQGADRVIFVTSGAMEGADRRAGLSGKGRVIYPGAAPASLWPREKGEPCRFAHFGSFGGSRNALTILEGLRMWLEEAPEARGRARFEFYGTMDRLSAERIAEFPYPDTVFDGGRIPRDRALEAMRKSDVLLLIQNTEPISRETIPSKLYEYLHAGRPVLGLTWQNPELDALLRRFGHTASPADSPEAAAEAIARHFGAWQAGGGPPPEPCPYTIEAAVDRLIEVAGETA